MRFADAIKSLQTWRDLIADLRVQQPAEPVEAGLPPAHHDNDTVAAEIQERNFYIYGLPPV